MALWLAALVFCSPRWFEPSPCLFLTPPSSLSHSCCTIQSDCFFPLFISLMHHHRLRSLRKLRHDPPYHCHSICTHFRSVRAVPDLLPTGGGSVPVGPRALRGCHPLGLGHGIDHTLPASPNQCDRLRSSSTSRCAPTARRGASGIPSSSSHGLNSLFQELSHLTNSFAQLRQAQAKFKACMDNVKQITPENKSTCESLAIYQMVEWPT